MDTFFQLIVTVLCFAALFLHVFSLPANWFLLGIIAFWRWLNPQTEFSWFPHFTLSLFVCVLAEFLEFLCQVKGAQKFGATKRGGWGGIAGALAGAIVGTPFLLGAGALIGASLGAYGGSFLVEKVVAHRSWKEAHYSSLGTFWGKLSGMIIKMTCGALILGFFLRTLW